MQSIQLDEIEDKPFDSAPKIRRPSAFSPRFSEFSRAKLHEFYVKDIKSGELVSNPPPARHSSTSLRLIQWNINSLMYGHSLTIGPAVASQKVSKLLLDLEPDVITLQEFGSIRMMRRSSIESYPGLLLLVEILETSGFELFFSPNAFPTLVAARFPANVPSTGRMLSSDRGVVRVVVRTHDGNTVAINGTHLDAYDDTSRFSEAAILLADADAEPTLPTIFSADMNQPRERDYAPEEWDWISKSRSQQNSPQSDGVSEMWEEAGFRCCFDDPKADRNWPADCLPPPTHWTGTNIDHTYGRGLKCVGVYVIPSLLSDHLPVLSDWVITAGKP